MEHPTIPDEASGIDLSEFCGSSVKFSNEDLFFTNPDELFLRIPEWDNIHLRYEHFRSPTGSLELERSVCFSRGSFGMACRATLVDPKTKQRLPCVVKFVRVHTTSERLEALKEFMIHAILTHTCTTDMYILDRQAQGRMATISKLFAGFRVKGHQLNMDGSTNGVGAEYFVSVMENAGDASLNQTIQESTDTPNLISSVTAFAVYQISSLIERLGDLVQFNHRDLHGENILVNYRNPTSSGRKMCGMTDVFTCCVIDFGYSRLTFRERDILCSYERLRDAGNPVQQFNIGHDTVYLLRTLRKKICGSVNVHHACTVEVIPELVEFINSVLLASGLDFESNACSSTTRTLITVLTYVGNFEKLQICQGGRYANPTNVIRPYLFHPRTVKMVSASILRILGVHCFDSGNSTRLEETRAAFREALERDIGVDVNLEDISR